MIVPSVSFFKNIFVSLACLVPLFALALSSGGGYTLNGQANQSGGVASGNGYTLQTGSSSINQNASGGGYTMFGGTFRSQQTDVDNDGVRDALEDLGLNGGDGNDDAIPDARQSHVVTLAGDNTTHAVALEVTSTDCALVTSFADEIESMMSAADTGYSYPVGLIDFSLDCAAAGDSATVRVYFDANYSTTSSSWVFRKWSGSSWSTLSPQPTLGTHTFVNGPLAGQTVTTATYSLTDGGLNDSDSAIDSSISDPVGPGIVVSTPSSGGGGGGGGIRIKKPDTVAVNICAQNKQGGWYRRCEIGTGLLSFPEFADNIACEGFIAHRDRTDDYEFTKNTPRKEALAIAVKMRRLNGQSIPLVTIENFTRSITDISYDTPGDWVPSIVETALAQEMISSERKQFEPNRLITRAEAYAMIMSSVCLVVPEEQRNTYSTWQEGIYDVAQLNGLTTRTWQTFEPQKTILRQELFVLASRAADWAERTGGCDPKPLACLQSDNSSIQDTILPNTQVESRTQEPGTFVYLYDTDYHQIYSYVVKSGGIPDGVRQAYIRTFGGSAVTANRLSVRDLQGTYYAEDRWFLAGEIVYVYLRKADQ